MSKQILYSSEEIAFYKKMYNKLKPTTSSIKLCKIAIATAKKEGIVIPSTRTPGAVEAMLRKLIKKNELKAIKTIYKTPSTKSKSKLNSTRALKYVDSTNTKKTIDEVDITIIESKPTKLTIEVDSHVLSKIVSSHLSDVFGPKV